MSRMDSFFNRSPLNTIVSRKLISFPKISVFNLMVAWNLLAFRFVNLLTCIEHWYSWRFGSSESYLLVMSSVTLP